jgi:hypothetical protein
MMMGCNLLSRGSMRFLRNLIEFFELWYSPLKTLLNWNYQLRAMKFYENL